MGSLQQPICIKGSALPSKRFGIGISGNQNHVKLISVGPCRTSQLEGSLTTGRPPSSVSVPIPEMGGKGFISLKFLLYLNVYEIQSHTIWPFWVVNFE